MMKLTKEESVYVEQLHDIRRRAEILRIEEITHTDRLLTILRGNQAKVARTHDNQFEIGYFMAMGQEGVTIHSNPTTQRA